MGSNAVCGVMIIITVNRVAGCGSNGFNAAAF